MLRIFLLPLLVVLSLNIHEIHLSSLDKSTFEFSKEARDALCPFVGTEGMQCFDGEPLKRTGRQFDADTLKLPRGVGISVDRSTGRLKALAIQLTYSPETGRIWTDGFTSQLFDIYNEVMVGSAKRVAEAYNASRIQIFRNASELNAIWQQTFIDGRIRGGQLAHPPDLFKYKNEFTRHNKASVLFQSVTALYTLAINPATIQLNSFARGALSKLTPELDLDLYEDFVNKWGTHIVTKSLIGGMIEKQAQVDRCFHHDENSSFIQCLPFEDRHLRNPTCTQDAEKNSIVSKRRLGGNAQVDDNHTWKQTLSPAPALLQILEMVPWYDFVRDSSIKKNLLTITRYRQKIMDSIQATEIRCADARPPACLSGTTTTTTSTAITTSTTTSTTTSSTSTATMRMIPNLPINARWEQEGVTVAGGNGAGRNNNQLYWPWGLFVVDDDEQTIVIADWQNHRIMQWKRGDTQGQVVAGGNSRGNRLDQLNFPTDVLIDKETNSLIIADRDNWRVVRWSRRSGTTQAEILIDNISCWGLAMDGQRNLYVSDIGKYEVRRYEIDRGDKTGTVVAGGNGKGSGLNQLNWPTYLFVDRNQSLYVSDNENHRVMKWDKGAAQGVVVAGGQGAGSALTQLSHPNGIFVDTLGTLYVAEPGNDRVTRWPQGSEKKGTVVVGGNGRGSAANQFGDPVGLSFDKHGNLYVVDHGVVRVQRFNLIK